MAAAFCGWLQPSVGNLCRERESTGGILIDSTVAQSAAASGEGSERGAEGIHTVEEEEDLEGRLPYSNNDNDNDKRPTD